MKTNLNQVNTLSIQNAAIEITEDNVIKERCSKCHFQDICKGTILSARVGCDDFRRYLHKESPPWDEMSYFKENRLRGKSIQQRLRDGE